MTRKGVPKTTVDRIRTKVRQGKSANQIQRELKREHRGIRRTQLLAYVREFKGRPSKPHVERYIPRKYRRVRVAPRPTPRPEKHIAVYGKVHGKSRRLEIFGSGKQLYSVLGDAVYHPPKQRIERVSANKLMPISGRGKYLDLREEWDDRSTIKS